VRPENRPRRRWHIFALLIALLTFAVFFVGMRTIQVGLTFLVAYYVYWLTRKE
jgi:hypothetical protein